MNRIVSILKIKQNEKLTFLTALFFCSTFLHAQDSNPWTVYMTPSEVHKRLSHYTGNFTMEITISIETDKEPTIIVVNSEHKMLLGGRFLEMKQQGVMMGMDYQSIMTIGFNNIDRQMSLTI